MEKYIEIKQGLKNFFAKIGSLVGISTRPNHYNYQARIFQVFNSILHLLNNKKSAKRKEKLEDGDKEKKKKTTGIEW